MHIDLNWTSFLFRGSIFCLFAYKVYQLFIKKSLKNYLDNELQAAKNEQVEFVERDTLLLSTRKRLESQLASQKQLFTTLEKKYAQFVAVEREKHEQEEALMAERLEKIAKKRQEQASNLAELIALRAAVPLVVQQARVQLVEEYVLSKRTTVLSNYLKTLA